MNREVNDVNVAIAVLIFAVIIIAVFVSETKTLARDVVREMVKSEALKSDD